MKYLQSYESYQLETNVKVESLNEGLFNLNWDDLVDHVSLACEGIPGIGSVVSAGIDISHALSYLVRWSTSKTEDEKIEFGLMGAIGLITCFIPGVGNATNILARGGIKKILSQTPSSIIDLARKYKIVEKPLIDLTKKTRWQYSLALFIGRYVRYDFINKIKEFINKLTKLKTKDNLINSVITKFTNDLNSILSYLQYTSQLASKAQSLL